MNHEGMKVVLYLRNPVQFRVSAEFGSIQGQVVDPAAAAGLQTENIFIELS